MYISLTCLNSTALLNILQLNHANLFFNVKVSSNVIATNSTISNYIIYKYIITKIINELSKKTSSNVGHPGLGILVMSLLFK